MSLVAKQPYMEELILSRPVAFSSSTPVWASALQPMDHPELRQHDTPYRLLMGCSFRWDHRCKARYMGGWLRKISAFYRTVWLPRIKVRLAFHPVLQATKKSGKNSKSLIFNSLDF